MTRERKNGSDDGPPSEDGSGMDRRQFLRRSIALAGLAVLGGGELLKRLPSAQGRASPRTETAEGKPAHQLGPLAARRLKASRLRTRERQEEL